MAGWHEDFEDETFPPELDEALDDYDDEREEEEMDEPDQFRDDVEADADALASMGWGTDEDYGGYDDYGDDYGMYDEPW